LHSPTGCAVHWLGLCAEFGKGMKKDVSKACEYYAKGSDCSERRGDSRHCYGFCHENGIGTQEDLGKAAWHYELSSADGNSIGSLHSALCFQFGRGVDMDLDSASGYYERFCVAGGRRERDRFRCLRSLCRRV
jgi:TPR repeat protein